MKRHLDDGTRMGKGTGTDLNMAQSVRQPLQRCLGMCSDADRSYSDMMDTGMDIQRCLEGPR